MQRPWRDVTYWLASPGLLSLLSYRTQDHQPRMAPPTMDWALPHQSPRKCFTAGSYGGIFPPLNFFQCAFIFILYTLVFCLHICLCEGVRFPKTGVTGRCDLPCECWKLNPSPLEKQPVLLTTQLSFQPHGGISSAEVPSLR